MLTLVEDVFSEGDNKEAESELQRVFSRPSWSPAEELEQDSGIHTPWPGAVGEYYIHCCFTLFDGQNESPVINNKFWLLSLDLLALHIYCKDR